MKDVVIVAATRTAIGAFQGSLASLSAADLGAAVIRRLLESAGLNGAEVDEVILGQVLTAGCGQNPARQAAMRAGLPHTVPAMTINKVCGSGLKSAPARRPGHRLRRRRDRHRRRPGNMSQAPYLLPAARTGLRLGHGQVLDSLLHDGLWDAFNDYHMGITAENLAEQYGISRDAQDAFAAASQQKALRRPRRRALRGRDRPGEHRAEEGRTGWCSPSTSSRARRAPPWSRWPSCARRSKKDGTVTAGNASTLNDGAAAVLLMSADKAAGPRPRPLLGRIAAAASAGVDPAIMGIGPVRRHPAAAWTRPAGSSPKSSASRPTRPSPPRPWRSAQALGWDAERVNVNGGAIALGHPIGASGCRILVSLLHEMQRSGARKGLATLCIGGGQGVALAIAR